MDKEWIKSGRRFLNTARNSTCTGAVRWSVEYCPPNQKRKAAVYSEFGVNEEAQNQWVGKRGDLKAIRNLRAELDKFEDAVMEALAQAEEANAKS